MLALLHRTARSAIGCEDGTVEAMDNEGHTQPNADERVHLTTTVPGQLIAVGTGDGKSEDASRADTFVLFHGSGLAILRTTRMHGRISLSASADGLAATSVVVESRQTGTVPEIQ